MFFAINLNQVNGGAHPRTKVITKSAERVRRQSFIICSIGSVPCVLELGLGISSAMSIAAVAISDRGDHANSGNRWSWIPGLPSM
jgi:hypothetical protein